MVLLAMIQNVSDGCIMPLGVSVEIEGYDDMCNVFILV